MTSVLAVEIGDSLQQGLDQFFAFLPNLIGFLVILIVGFIIARIIKGVITKLLQKVGLDRTLHSGQTGQYVERISPGASPSALIAGVVFWFIFIFVLSAAIGALKIPAVTTFMNQVLAYLPNVIVAVIIFVVAGAIAGAVGGLVTKAMGDTPTGKVVAAVVPTLILGIAVFMILQQLKIAPEIVQITYTALLGALALGLALAFGLGGRDVAARLLEDAYDKGQEQKGQVKQDARLAKERGQQQAERAQTQVQGGGQSQGGGQGSARPGATPASDPRSAGR
jgi:hypothetical protein